MFCVAEVGKTVHSVVGDGNAITMFGKLLTEQLLIHAVIFHNKDVDV